MRLIAILFTSLPLLAQLSVEQLWEQRFQKDVKDYAEKLDGVVGLAAIDLSTGHTLCFQCDVQFPTASSIKIPILIGMFRAMRNGEFKIEDKLTLDKKDMAGGSGHLNTTIEKGPLTLTVRELMTAMIETSDNTATNRCILMAGMERVNSILDEFGLREIRLQRVMMDIDAALADRENIATPREMARLVEMLYRNAAAPAEDCKAMFDIMRLVKGGMNKALPAGVDIASKTGGITGVKNQVGIIYLKNRPFVLSIYGTYLGDPKLDPVEDLTRVAFRYFERLSHANKYGHLAR
ncbi:MAG: serine hydrolase [Acidobacteriota bacterium]